MRTLSSPATGVLFPIIRLRVLVPLDLLGGGCNRGRTLAVGRQQVLHLATPRKTRFALKGPSEMTSIPLEKCNVQKSSPNFNLTALASLTIANPARAIFPTAGYGYYNDPKWKYGCNWQGWGVCLT